MYDIMPFIVTSYTNYDITDKTMISFYDITGNDIMIIVDVQVVISLVICDITFHYVIS